MLATVEQQASLNNSKIIQALYCFLDDTHIYPVLKDMNEFPPLTQTISRIINLQESLDLDYINREVNDRKTRLGADTAANIRIAMEKEVLLHSRLDVFYDRLISLSNAGGPSSSSSTTSDLKLKLLDLRNKRLIYSSNENDKRHFLGIVLNLASELVNLNCNISSALPYEILIDYSDVTIGEFG